MNYGMGQNFNPHVLRLSIKDLDLKWCPYYTMQERQIQVKKIVGKRTYKKMVKKLSR